jgi:hypothetical protein
MNVGFQAVAAFRWCTLASKLSRTEVMRRNTDNFLATLITAVAPKR